MAHGTEMDILQQVVGMLVSKTAGQLIAITHWSHGAWVKNYIPRAKHRRIPNEDIINEYNERTVVFGQS